MKHFVQLSEVPSKDLESLITLAHKIMDNPGEYSQKARGKILGTLFFEPSTRTRLSFESAMLRLGGQTLGFSDASSCSAKKGETPEDTCRMAGIYADILAVRHPVPYTPHHMAEVTEVPVINAGDGANEHPTQTLTDLITLYERFGRLDHLTIGLCGDLKYGRTVHSLVQALKAYPGNRFIFIAPPELRMPQEYLEFLDGEAEYTETENLEASLPALDALYMTRIQEERFTDKEEYGRLKGMYCLTREKLNLARENMIVMHPLPRVDEIDTDVDSDPRAWYFKQAKFGMYGRMALILELLGLTGEKEDFLPASHSRAQHEVYLVRTPSLQSTK